MNKKDMHVVGCFENGLQLPSPNRIHFVIWKFGDNEPEINIEGRNLTYAQLGKTHHGLQCNHIGDTSKHRLITRKLKKISELFKDIENLNEI